MSTQRERDSDPMIGARVQTKLDTTAAGWAACFGTSRRDAVTGTVVDLSNAHGLCYMVEHDGGGHAWYLREELLTLAEAMWGGLMDTSHWKNVVAMLETSE